MHIIQKRNKLTLALLVAVAILLVAGGYLAYAYTTKSTWPFSDNHTSDDTKTSDGINYSPPTEQEIESGQEEKKNDYEKGESTPSGNGEKKTVSVGIAFAGFDSEEDAVDVRAFVPDVIESDGTCTATFTRGATTVSQSSKAFVDFSSSQCEPILLPVDRFDTKGTWKLVVSYSSSKSSGISPSMDVEI